MLFGGLTSKNRGKDVCEITGRQPLARSGLDLSWSSFRQRRIQIGNEILQDITMNQDDHIIDM